jgi:hypothetical protein
LPLDQLTKLGKKKKKRKKNCTENWRLFNFDFFLKLVFFFQKPKLAGSLILKLEENWN